VQTQIRKGSNPRVEKPRRSVQAPTLAPNSYARLPADLGGLSGRSKVLGTLDAIAALDK
jgi:hypothetical protein